MILALTRALRHAHEQGVIHRDLKPENVMVTGDGQLKLMDFGIAQIMDGASRLTATGTLLGSPAHMAPEIIDGKPPDHRADLFSLGTILYWVLTGALPFEAPNPSALFRRILEGAYEPLQLRAPKVGNSLARVVERALEPALEARYQDISELETDLVREVSASGLEPDDGLIQEALQDPQTCSNRLEPELVERLRAEGRSALDDGALSRAADRLNRVLAHRPGDPDATALLARATRPKRRPPVVIASVGLLMTGAVVAGALSLDGDLIPPFRETPTDPRPTASVPIALARSPVLLAGERESEGASPSIRPEDRAAGSASLIVTRPEPERDRPRPVARNQDALLTAKDPRRAARPSASAAGRGRRLKPSGRSTFRPSPPVRTAPAGTPVASEPEKRGESNRRGEADAPAAAILRVRVGQSFANVRLNGQLRFKDSYRADLRLKPGIHEIEVVKPGLGRFRPRSVEVSPAGDLFERRTNGRRLPLVGGFLDFRVPLSPTEAADTKGWTPEPEPARD